MKCKKCNHIWKPRLSLPNICPKCKTKYWKDYKKKEHKINGRDVLWNNVVFGKYLLALSNVYGIMALHEEKDNIGFTQKRLSEELNVSQPAVSKILSMLNRYIKKRYVSKHKMRYVINLYNLLEDFLSKCKITVLENLRKEMNYLIDKKKLSKKNKRSYDILINRVKKKINKFEKINLRIYYPILLTDIKNCLFRLESYSKIYDKEFTIMDICNIFIFNLPSVAKAFNMGDFKDLVEEYREWIILEDYNIYKKYSRWSVITNIKVDSGVHRDKIPARSKKNL